MNILIVSPHPDDETLGAGGSLLRFANQGHKLFWLNITGMKSELGFNQNQIIERKLQIQKVKQFYPFEDLLDLQMPTTKLESCDSGEMIQKISEYFHQVQPELVILPDYNDAHSDHKCVFEWGAACTKVFRHPYVKSIITMEIASETDFGKPYAPFVPNLFIDISDFAERKLEALRIYESEMGEHPFPRSIKGIEALGTIRGAAAGVRYAEAFRIIKSIQ